MQIIELLIQYTAQALNRPFSYLYGGDKKVDIGFRVLVNFNNRNCVGYVTKIIQSDKTKEQIEEDTGFKMNYIIDVIDDVSLLNDELMKLADEVSEYYLAPKISVLQAMLPPSLKPTLSSLKGPKIAYDQYLIIKNYDESDLTPKQVELLRLIKNSTQILKKEAKSPSIVKKLIELKRIEIKYVERLRYVLPTYEKENKRQLTSDQEKAFNSVISTDKMVTLIHGVTGSGKTEVYMALCDYYLKANKSVLLLVPEISLTPQMVDYFLHRFEDKIAVLHSGLTPAEKYDEYRRIARNECRIVVGARSAIFAPLSNIGIIILDEEHVESYKQDTLPYYHAKDVAILRAKHNNAKVILGSATPSLETRARALKNVYNYVTLFKRINEHKLPKTTIVDLLDSRNMSRESVMFSTLLIEKIRQTLAKKQQVLILLNRRGFSSFVSCRSCGHIFKCPDCNVSLTYHKEDNMLKCHHCGHVEFMPSTCPECGGKYISRTGFGTERVIEDIAKLFPNAKTLRLDSDIGKVRNNISTTIEQFRNHEADILVGTQMIAKGHDFSNVTLVAVLLADLGLSLPSFRSSERTFQLITQAVGRSGRGNDVGEAIIQTYSPHHFAIELAAKQDYETFFKKEMYVRKIEQYPPYTYVTGIEIATSNEDISDKLIAQIAFAIQNRNIKDLTIVGPSRPYIQFEGGYYKRNLLLKYKSDVDIKRFLNEQLKLLQNKGNVRIQINVDTYNF